MEANKNILRTLINESKKISRLSLTGLFLSVFSFTLLSSLFIGQFQSVVLAAPSVDLTYVNYDIIEVRHGYTGNGLEQQVGRFLLSNDKDNSASGADLDGLLYTLDRNKGGRDRSAGSCVPSILIKDVNDKGLPENGNAELVLKKNDGNGSASCASVVKRDVSIKNWSAGSKTFFNWKNADVLLPVGPSLPYEKESGGARIDSLRFRQFGAFIKQANGNYSNIEDSDRCKSFISNITDTSGKTNFHNGNDDGNCTEQYRQSFTANIGLKENRSIPFDDPEAGGTENDAAIPDSQNGPSLECNVGLNPLNWLLCGAVKGMVNIVGQLDNLINSLLSVGSNGTSDDPSQIFGDNSDGEFSIESASDSSSSQSYYKAWATMRNIALGLMAIIGLIVIIAQALGTELLDAYTLKKALPRFLIAALAIALSWQLLQFLVTITNQLGFGIRYLMYEPFIGFNADLADSLGGGEKIAVSLIGLGAIGALGIFGLLSFAATAALAVFVAFLILILRQIIIIILIIFAPIAIAAYVLPNTNKFYNIWWESLEKALLMFPLIAAMIAAGRIFSAVALSNDPGPIQELIGFAAYFAPYFAIPFALKFAGGALATIGGFANNANRGGFDRLKKYRGATMAKRGQSFKAGSLYQNRGLGKVVNNAGRRVAVGTQGRFGVGATGRAALGLAAQAGNEETLRNNPALRQLQNNDDANNLLALSGGSEGGAKAAAKELFGDDTNRADAAMAAARAVGFTRQNASAAFETSAKNKWRAVGSGRYDTLQNGINRLAGGNSSEAKSMAFSTQYFNRESGRTDLGGNWLSEDIQTRASSLAARNYGNNDISTAEGQENVRKATSDLIALDGMGRTSVQATANGFSAQTKQNTDTLGRMLKYGNEQERQVAATRMLELQKALPYTSGDNQKIINKMLETAGINYSDTGASVDQQLAAKVSGASLYETVTRTVVNPSTNQPVIDPTTGQPMQRSEQQVSSQVSRAATELARGARTYDQDPSRIGQDSGTSQG